MEHHSGDTPGHAVPAHRKTLGVHGMLILGGGHADDLLGLPVYASHLPMFMAPHDFQVTVRVTGKPADKYSAVVGHGSQDIYTFKPKRFSIDELAPVGGGLARKSFSGTLFSGHFERGGSELGTGSLQVKQVVYFTRFTNTGNAGRGALRYLCFGERNAAFLAHLITAPPDFDQLLAVELSSLSGVSDKELRAGVIVAVPGRADDVKARLQEGETFSGQVQAQKTGTSGSIELTVAREYYLETGDLAAAM